MNLPAFERFREWVKITRRRKRSKKPSMAPNVMVQFARKTLRSGCNHLAGTSDEINLRSEPVYAEFIAELRSSEVSWLNIKQLLEPHATAGELTSTRPI